MMIVTRKQKRIVLIIMDTYLVAVSFALTYFYLQRYLLVPIQGYILMGLLVTLSYLLAAFKLKVYSIINRFTSTREVSLIILSVVVACSVGLVYGIAFPNYLSWRVFTLSMLFINLLLVGSRMVWRIFMEYRHNYKLKTHYEVSNIKRTIVIGAGWGASVLFNHFKMEDEIYKIIGILDDDYQKRSTYLYGCKVLGKIADLHKFVEMYEVEHIIVAIPSLPVDRLTQLVDVCNELRLTINTLPPFNEILSMDKSKSKLKGIEISDLLGRDEVELDIQKISSSLENEVLLVTGAGGSIGSEICRQVAKFKPSKLILLGHGENSIYLIHRELIDKYGFKFEIIPIIADIQDREEIFEIMDRYKPSIVYHAAAHKHVPLMECNPIEAVKNNIFGTKNVAEAAKVSKVANFVMVSTDKVVNPTSVMGATKRIAEMIVTGLNEPNCTKFCSVRFGNVLGSRGSVVPLFQDQISKGGPITITDFNMTRYFMTIPEASRLVIQAGTLAKGAEIFILDMGKPVRIFDLAKNLIRLSGYTESQIEIIETGIRPGEKLCEELLLDSEATGKEVFEKIFIGNVPVTPLDEVMSFVDSLANDGKLPKRLLDYANFFVNDKESTGDEAVEMNSTEQPESFF